MVEKQEEHKKENSLQIPEGLEDLLSFPLLQALHGRRARRFSLGSTIPDGPLAFASKEPPIPLSECEKLVLLSSIAGNTGWNYLISRHPKYAPKFPNYSGAASGRPFPSAAGIHTSEIFFTDDSGIYLFESRDHHPSEDFQQNAEDLKTSFLSLMETSRSRIRRISEKRLWIPREEPHMEGHNFWCANTPGSTLIIPVADVAQHLLAILSFLLQNGFGIYDDIHKQKILGLDQYHKQVDLDRLVPLSCLEQDVLAECSAELASSCYAGALTLQGMGLGGWMFDGMDRHSVLGASGDPDIPGLGFRYDFTENMSVPNVTGLTCVFEGFCPPHFASMREAVNALEKRKFGMGGPFHEKTQGPWKDSEKLRSSAAQHDEAFKECLALQAQYIFDRFGKFPGTVPSIFSLTYLQAHHLDLNFYDHYFKPGAYLDTHSLHMDKWHSD